MSLFGNFINKPPNQSEQKNVTHQINPINNNYNRTQSNLCSTDSHFNPNMRLRNYTNRKIINAKDNKDHHKVSIDNNIQIYKDQTRIQQISKTEQPKPDVTDSFAQTQYYKDSIQNQEITLARNNISLKNNWSKLFVSVSSKTKPGFNGITMKTNQDSFLCYRSFLDTEDNAVFGVFDGHGQHGHRASEYIKKNIVDNLKITAKVLKSTSGFQIDKQDHITKLMVETFHKTDNEMNKQLCDATELSGSTGNLVLVLGDKIYCGNAGDSRAQILS